MKLVVDDAVPVHTFINTFEVSRQNQESVVASLRTFTTDHARHLQGFIGAAVHASADGTRVVNYVQWRSAADMAAMLATDAARAHLAEVGLLAERITPVVYRVAYVGSIVHANR